MTFLFALIRNYISADLYKFQFNKLYISLKVKIYTNLARQLYISDTISKYKIKINIHIKI